MFEIFKPSKMPADVSTVCGYGTVEIQYFCGKFFRWDAIGSQCDSLLDEWNRLLLSLVLNKDYCSLREGSGTALPFWVKLLSMEDIQWTPSTRKLIQSILVLGVGTADAERGFSIMNHIKNKRRGSLNSEHLDAIMRIRINGPSNIEKFSAMKYAKAWIDDNHMRTDDPADQKRRSNDLDEGDNEDGETKRNKNAFESSLF